ncbi:DUF4097 domain-containing protein [Bacillus shivajii]|uniref:DUF4097 family beta strand repeat-containing protein n=1 Tax=Bacillus shivajii TaxID=1983719 RepID=UPI001CFB1C6B|nr:DUF4097 domain-containing protein [Bacillus shivajii]UCZ52653.1 DUF4097 domain-containing protein [Bacillus shivajii]
MQEERKKILQMIEDGKISADEGVDLLNALKETEKEKHGAKSDKGSETEEQSLSRDVDWEKGTGYRQTEQKVSSFASKFTDFIEDAVQKIKEFDLDFNFGSSVEIQHIFQHKEATVRHADISIENGSITFRPWEEDDIRVECNVKVYKVRDSDEARRHFLDEVVFDLSNEKLRLESRKKSMKVNTIVYVPKKDLERLKLYAFNGKLTGEHVSVKKFEAQTVNGRISFDEVEAEDVRLETVNGTISISKLQSEHCDAKTVNGTVAISAAKGDIDAETLNGTINYKLLKPSNSRAYLKTTTGSVTFTVPENVKTEGELKTTVGGIHCDLPNVSVIDEKKEIASKKMTFLSNRDEESASVYIEAEATTGSITVRN